MSLKLSLLGFGLMLSLFSCRENTLHQASGWRQEHINGRYHQPVYEVDVPTTWKRLEATSAAVEDTKTPLATYIFSENNQTFTVTIHNFPTDEIEDQIPPLAQVERWKGQFERLELKESDLQPVSFAGYTGQYFKGVGLFKGQREMMLAWSLQIPPEHYRSLTHPDHPQMKSMYDQMRADVTIKVLGPVDLVNKHREDIDKFVNSFHLIHEIPST